MHLKHEEKKTGGKCIISEILQKVHSPRNIYVRMKINEKEYKQYIQYDNDSAQHFTVKFYLSRKAPDGGHDTNAKRK